MVFVISVVMAIPPVTACQTHTRVLQPLGSGLLIQSPALIADLGDHNAANWVITMADIRSKAVWTHLHGLKPLPTNP